MSLLPRSTLAYGLSTAFISMLSLGSCLIAHSSCASSRKLLTFVLNLAIKKLQHLKCVNAAKCCLRSNGFTQTQQPDSLLQ